MYAKCLYTKCIPNFDKLLYIFCIKNLAGIYSSFDFAYKMYTKVCQNVVYILYIYILYTSDVFILYNFFI